VVPDSSSAAHLEPLDPIDHEVLAQFLKNSGSGIQAQVLAQCGSTNSLLLERARTGAPHASALVCEHQTSGKGRRGSAWISAPGASLAFSLLWRFGSGVSALSGLSLAVAVACARALESQGAAQIKFKWPNDLLFDARKLGGILVETLQDAGSAVAVIGIGLNVRVAPALRDRVGHPVADLREAGALGTRAELLAAQLAQLARLLPAFEAEGFAPLRDEWLGRHAWQGRNVRLSSGERMHAQGEAVGVAEDGALLLRTAGVVKPYYSGELSLRLA
jgi:BirA family biotin operon repressor/biotin-[acetyl-CoA-carboxylase] ligase